ncbi:hypothetical protein STEG23_027030 [Scotinomys teguina]
MNLTRTCTQSSKERPGGAVGQGVEQPAKLMSVEGTFVQVNCTYSTSGFNGLAWYRHHEGQAPAFLSYDALDGLKDGITRRVNERTQHRSMDQQIISGQLENISSDSICY